MSRKPFGNVSFGIKKKTPTPTPESAISAAETSKKRDRPAVFGDDTLDDDSSQLETQPKRFKLTEFDLDEKTPAVPAVAANPKKEEEEAPKDVLDQFFDEIEKSAEVPAQKIHRADFEEEDDMESFLKAHEENRKNKIIEAGLDANQTDLYSIDEKDLDQMIEAQQKKKMIKPLPMVYHSQIEYEPFEKDFYEEHEEISAMSSDEVIQYRKELEIRVSGASVPRPVKTFIHLGLGEELMRAIRKHKYTEPTPIQRQAIPVAMSGRDIIGIAKTGSGKTAAFVIPMMVHIMDQRIVEPGEGPIGVIIAPTHELAHQIYLETIKFAKNYQIRVSAVYGGMSKHEQSKELKNGTEVIVCTPGRLMEMLQMKNTCNLLRCTYLVLDEADRMFDMGFEPQVRSIAQNIRPERQTLLFSATFKKTVENVAREILTDPVRISVGVVGEANEDITQIVHVIKDDSEKWTWLMQTLPILVENGSVIIFVSTKNAVEELSANLIRFNFPCLGLHGDKLQHERTLTMKEFKSGRSKILVATDVAARGLDIPQIKTVINFDIPRNLDSHVHRIGRTGRAGALDGVAYSLITPKNSAFAAQLIGNLESANQVVPPELVAVAMQDRQFRSRGKGERGGRGGRGGGRGGRGGSSSSSSSFSPSSSSSSSSRFVPPPESYSSSRPPYDPSRVSEETRSRGRSEGVGFQQP